MTLLPSGISLGAFDDILMRYSSSVPSQLRELDELRFETIPRRLAQRKQDGKAYLEKDEVKQLVEWKLKHGTFRPSLLSLVLSNPPELLQSWTQEAYLLYDNIKPQDSPVPRPIPALRHLVSLKGIGPATASLLLAVYSPDEVPFFSDEMFRWTMWEEVEVKGKGKGWDRKIGYTNKEYEGVARRVERVRKRLGVNAVDLEKVAWVLGKEGVDVGLDAVGDEGEGEKKVEKKEKVSKVSSEKIENVGEKVAKSKKRKGDEDEKPPVEGLRRSKRKT